MAYAVHELFQLMLFARLSIARVSIATMVLVAGCRDAPRGQPQQVQEHVVLRQVMLASDSPSNLALIITAGSRTDLDAIDAMEADGRLVLLQPNTVLDCRYASTEVPNAIAVLFVTSGKLIGRQLYAYKDAVDFSEKTLEQAWTKLGNEEKTLPKSADRRWIEAGGGLIELVKLQRDIQEFNERTNKALRQTPH
jgi:hypothetical protein